MFVENVGQFDPAVAFAVQGPDGALWLTDEAIWVSVSEKTAPDALGDPADVAPESGRAVALRLTLTGADFTHPEPADRLATSVNYFTGSDPQAWRTNVPAWGTVRYRNAYPGYDLEVTGAASGWR